jgi:hypothetical protein
MLLRYTDPYSSTDPKSPAYFGNLSFVLHLANKSRIACANFGPAGAPVPSYSPGNSTISATPTAGMPVVPTSTSSSTLPPFTGAAVKIVGGTGAMLAAAAALLL